jgi:hypothetical protein
MKKHHILIKKVCFLKKRPLFCHFFNQNERKVALFLLTPACHYAYNDALASSLPLHRKGG